MSCVLCTFLCLWSKCDVYVFTFTAPYLYYLVLSLSTCGGLEVRPSILLVPGRTWTRGHKYNTQVEINASTVVSRWPGGIKRRLLMYFMIHWEIFFTYVPREKKGMATGCLATIVCNYSACKGFATDFFICLVSLLLIQVLWVDSTWDENSTNLFSLSFSSNLRISLKCPVKSRDHRYLC